MCPRDDSRLTLEFKNHIIIPSINLNHSIKKFTVNNRKEKGKFVKSDFEYHSGTSINFLNVNQIKISSSKLNNEHKNFRKKLENHPTFIIVGYQLITINL